MELATRFNGEIINGDAMQMYNGLPIITNKITPEEQNQIPHHLLGFIGLDEEPWRVGLFRKKASQVIQEIRSRGRLPILVGGTHYYTQSLLIEESLIDDQHDDGEDELPELTFKELSQKFPILEEPTEIILDKLREVDPIMADRWHPRDRRKIQRSLEIFLQTGKRASDLYREQKERKRLTINPIEGEPITSALDEDMSPLVFWVHTEAETLKARLDARIDKMIQTGLLDEVKAMDKFLQHHTEVGLEIDSSRGIWISIGWKEFEPYLQALRTGTASRERLEELLSLSTEQTKAATRQYAKRQIRWIRLKLFAGLEEKKLLDKFYLLDATNISRWPEAVLDPATDVTRDFLAGREPRSPKSLSDVASELLAPGRKAGSRERDVLVRHECEICHTVCTTEEQWQSHIKGRTHRRGLKKQHKRSRRERSPANAHQSSSAPEQPFS